MNIAEFSPSHAPSAIQQGRPIKDCIASMVSPILDFHSLSLVAVHQSRQSRRHYVRLVLYRQNGVSLSELTIVHNTIHPRLTVLLGDKNIALEISTPGIDYVFKNDSDYTVFRGQHIRVLSKRDNLWHDGILVNRDTQNIMLKNVIGKTEQYPINSVIKVVLNNRIDRGVNQ